MNLSPEFMVMIGGAIVFIFTAGVAWNNISGKVDNEKEEREKLQAEIVRLFAYKDEMAKDSAIYRLEQQKNYGEILATLRVHDSNYAEILRLIKSFSESMENRFNKLEDELRGQK